MHHFVLSGVLTTFVFLLQWLEKCCQVTKLGCETNASGFRQ